LNGGGGWNYYKWVWGLYFIRCNALGKWLDLENHFLREALMGPKVRKNWAGGPKTRFGKKRPPTFKKKF